MIAPEEATLLSMIHRRLPPDEQQRLATLRAKLEAEQLTEAEHMELGAYIDRVEQQDAERLQALVDLAGLRGVPFKTIVSEFLPDPAKRM